MALHTINASQVSDNYSVHGVAEIEKIIGVEAMLFGKPDCYPNRRLGIIFALMWKQLNSLAKKYHSTIN